MKTEITVCHPSEMVMISEDNFYLLLKRIKTLETEQKWQPIETAPKDGRVILLYGELSVSTGGAVTPRKSSNEVYIGHWHTRWQTGNFAIWENPTHWMPLPEPPEALKDDS